eukprot:GILK01014795.1.p1 GENE.GILK01014795.1~~GILK01014795.1.p1  ORF type:complete len:549 (-),score=69.73 GILK01014795.1:73-1602(-)
MASRPIELALVSLCIAALVYLSVFRSVSVYMSVCVLGLFVCGLYVEGSYRLSLQNLRQNGHQQGYVVACTLVPLMFAGLELSASGAFRHMFWRTVACCLAAQMMTVYSGHIRPLHNLPCLGLCIASSWITSHYTALAFLPTTVCVVVFWEVVANQINRLPKSFTLCEGFLVGQACGLLCSAVVDVSIERVDTTMWKVSQELYWITLALAITPLLLAAVAASNNGPFTRLSLCCLQLCLTFLWLTWMLRRDPVSWLVLFLLERSSVRLGLLIFWAVCVAVGVTVAKLLKEYSLAHPLVLPNILIRKFFHILCLIMFVPGIYLEPLLMSLAFAVALFAFQLAEILRVSNVPTVAPVLDVFMKRFLDDRDGGVVILTHTYLLIGCAIPRWMSLALHVPTSVASVDPMLGLLALGVADTAASAVGIRYGRTKWPGSGKSVEGTVAAVVSVIISVYIIQMLLTLCSVPIALHPFPFFLSTVVVCVWEAVTDQIDNLLLPLAYVASFNIFRATLS